MSLALKYRPKTFDEFEGNEETVQKLTAMLKRKDGLPHAILLTGPSGNGKTTLARIIKNELGCSDIDFYEYNTADFNGIDMVRDLRTKVQFMPMQGSVSVYLIDECHGLTKSAQEAILKLLEDAPAHVYFILATTNPEKLLRTIKTRCTPLSVSELNPRRIQRLLKKVAKKENLDVPKEVIDKISIECMGSCRSALVILDAIKDLSPEDMVKNIEKKADKESELRELCQALLKCQTWKQVSKIVKGIDVEPETARRMILGYMSTVLLSRNNSDRASEIIDEMSTNYFDSGKAGFINSCYVLSANN